MAMYALGGTSLLFTIDGKLKKELDNNNKLLSETIGADKFLTMSERPAHLEFVTEETTNIYNIDSTTQAGKDLIAKLTHSYTYKGSDGNPTTGTYMNASSFGTFLCNITRSCTPYGGYTKVAKDNSKYYSYSDIKEFNNNLENTIEVFDGDTYIGPFEYTSAHKVSNRAIGLLTTMNV
jgi:hypothetical protein|nr:MAG TPA: hypothetical protein [Caudoviricetes sp.]